MQEHQENISINQLIDQY